MRGGNGRFRADDLPVGLNDVDDVKKDDLPMDGWCSSDRALGNTSMVGFSACSELVQYAGV